MKYAKRLLAAALTGAMLVTSAVPVLADTAGSGVKLDHGTVRDQVITEDMVNNTPPADYTIPDGLVQDAKDGLYDKYFLKDELQTVSIRIEENNLNYMLQNALDKPSVMTTSVTIGDQTVGYAGLKTKGNYTLQHTFSDFDSDRFSFTINFGKYIKKKDYGAKQNFYGCNKISFNNLFFDKTALKEYNAMRLMSEMGVPTSQYGLAKLYINDQYYGVYFMVEAMDSSILEQHLDVSSKKISDYIAKPINTAFTYHDGFDAYKTEDGTFTMDSLSSILYQNEDGDYVADSDLWSAGLWEEDSDTLQDVAEMLPTVLTWEEKLNLLSNGKDFSGNAIDVNSQDYLDLLEQVMDTDETVRYFATHSFIVQMDDMFTNYQNFGLYVDEDGRSMLLPWDYDLGWGCYTYPNTAEDVANLDLDNMYSDKSGTAASIYKKYPIFNVIYQNTSLREKYHTYMEDCAKIASIGGTTSDGATYEAGRFVAAMDVLENKIIAAMSEKLADNVYYVNYANQPNDAANGFPNLRKMIAMRSVGVWLQTNNIDSKVTGYGCNLASTGNAVNGKASTSGKLTVVNADTEIFATATYGSGSGGPNLVVTEMTSSFAVYQSIAKKLGNNVVVYQMRDSKTPVSDYQLYIPLSADSQKVKIYSYSAEKDTLTTLKTTVNDNLYQVTTSDISYIAISLDGTVNLANADISVSDCVYDGTAKTPSVTVKCFGETLSSDLYTVTYANNINAGTATVTVQANGKGNYTGSATKTFNISKAANSITVAKTSVTKSASTKAQKLSLGASAKYGKLTYTSSSSKVKVDANGKVTLPKKFSGKVTITVKTAGDANHVAASSKVTITVPAAAKVNKVKKASGRKAKVTWKKVSGVTGYQIQYATNKKFTKAKTVKVKGAAKTSKTLTKLKKGKTYYVRIRTYKTVSGKNYTSVWSSAKKVTI